MSKKKKVVILIVISFLLMALLFFLIRISLRDNTKEVEMYEPVSIEDVPDELEKDFYADALGSKGADDENVAIIAVTNKEKLIENSDEYLTDYAFYSLQEYLSRYINYYFDLVPGEIYEVSYVSGTYDSPSNFPFFRVEFVFNEQHYIIDCTFVPSLSRYDFYCEDIK